MSALLDSSISWDDFHVQTRCRTSVACNPHDSNDSNTSLCATSLSAHGATSPKRNSHGESVPNLRSSNHQKKRISRQASLSTSSSHSRNGMRRYLEKQRSYSTNGTTMGRISKGKFVPAKKLKS